MLSRIATHINIESHQLRLLITGHYHESSTISAFFPLQANYIIVFRLAGGGRYPSGSSKPHKHSNHLKKRKPSHIASEGNTLLLETTGSSSELYSNDYNNARRVISSDTILSDPSNLPQAQHLQTVNNSNRSSY